MVGSSWTAPLRSCVKTRTSRNSTLASAAVTARVSATSNPTSAANAGWLDAPPTLWQCCPQPAPLADRDALIVTDHFDQLEIRDPEQRELAQFNLLPDLIRHALSNAPGWAEHLKGLEVGAITSREALAKLPVLRKGALKDLQAKRPPYGGF